MNLALSALLIILLLLPGFAFRIGISLPIKRKQEFGEATHDIISRNIRKVLSKLNFSETIFLFSLIPLLLHLISLCLISLSGFQVHYSLLLNIFSGKQDVLLDSSNNLFHHELLSFLIYILIETALACLLGWLLIVLCGGKRWFLKLLVGNNVWFKLFSGASLTDMQKNELANILVEVLIETKESTVIYSGLLKNYEVVDNTDELAYITLTGAFRRDLRKAQLTSKELETATIVTASRFDIAYGDIIPIPGHTFTIPGKEIINWNVTYMKRVMDPNTKQPQLEPIKFD